jgi:membrane protein implicated in regulation of membrane protease activity
MGVFALLLSPVLLLPVAFVFVVVAVLICPGVTAKPIVGCSSCDSQLCPWSVAIVLFVALPLTLVSAYLLRRRKRHRP